MAKAIMVQGTMSSVGKSLVCTGLCRAFYRQGLRVAPFKSQNMALNSFITREGLEMGRAQAVQAEAAGLEPDVRMNPILLKPVTNTGSQVILYGQSRGNMNAAEYAAIKYKLIPEIMAAYNSLAAENDVIVIEGAGSPAEINLNADDFVNMGMAKLAKAPVILVGDIDRGGVFAQLYGTIALLDPEAQEIIKATLINKFCGNIKLFEPGISQLEKVTGRPVAGVLPLLNVDIDDEDSLSERLNKRAVGNLLELAVIHLPHISNFTDFSVLETTPGVGVRYVQSVSELGHPDLILLPGTQSTINDLKWLRQRGLEAAIKRLAANGTVMFGVCGGYQMLGRRITDRESEDITGLGLLPISTILSSEKRSTRVQGTILPCSGILAPMAGAEVEGYEIPMGHTTPDDDAAPLVRLDNGQNDGCYRNNVYGSCLHGFFDTADCRSAVLQALAAAKNVTLDAPTFDLAAYKETQYDLLADAVNNHLNMELIQKILEKGLQK